MCIVMGAAARGEFGLHRDSRILRRVAMALPWGVEGRADLDMLACRFLRLKVIPTLRSARRLTQHFPERGQEFFEVLRSGRALFDADIPFRRGSASGWTTPVALHEFITNATARDVLVSLKRAGQPRTRIVGMHMTHAEQILQLDAAVAAVAEGTRSGRMDAAVAHVCATMCVDPGLGEFVRERYIPYMLLHCTRRV